MVKIPIMGIDSTQYASISMEMFYSGDYLHVKNHSADYLDKPPLLFWLCTLFFKIFGVHDWSFRLPSFLSTLLGVYSVYRFSTIFYNKRVALNAALILFTCQAFFLINHDVRTDTLLANFVIFVCWQLAAFLKSGKFIFILGAFTGIGFAMLEKGPIGFMVPALAMGSHLIINKDIKNIFRWQWLIGILFSALILVPMCIGLYEQFDLHPEKIVNGKTGVSGLRFFFWEQSFGRITGENVWKDDSTYLFFTHTFIWSFLPWSFLATFALYKRIISIKNKEINPEYLTIGGFTFSFIALSFSQYKLPHYIFVLYPLAAVFTSAWMEKNIFTEQKKIIHWLLFQIILCLLLIVLVLGINLWSFPFGDKPFMIPLIIVFIVPVIVAFAYFKHQNDLRLLFTTAFSAVFINLILNANFYPSLLKYQSATEAGIYLQNKKPKAENCYYYHNVSFGLDFYTKIIWKDSYGIPWKEILKKSKGDVWIFTNQDGFTEISDSNLKIAEHKSFNDYNITALTLSFLNPVTREENLEKRYLIRLKNSK